MRGLKLARSLPDSLPMVNPQQMKAGTETGSLVNHLMSGSTSPAPVLGMGATVLQWTDRQAATVVSIAVDGRSILTRDDIAIRTDANGMSDAQSYTYERDENGCERRWKLAKDGTWRAAQLNAAGRVVFVDRGRGERLLLGHRRHYHDFSF